MNATEARYIKPKSATSFFNDTVGRLTKMGISVYGSRVLAVKGRKSGEWRTTPVNPLRVDGTRYLVARSEEHTSELQSHLNIVCRLLLEKTRSYWRSASSVMICNGMCRVSGLCLSW